MLYTVYMQSYVEKYGDNDPQGNVSRDGHGLLLFAVVYEELLGTLLINTPYREMENQLWLFLYYKLMKKFLHVEKLL